MKHLFKLMILSALLLSLLYSLIAPAFAVIVIDDAPEELADTGAEEALDYTGAPTIPSEMDFTVKLNELRKRYPHGTTWEGVYYENDAAKAWTCHAYAVQLFSEIFGIQFYTGGYFTNRDYSTSSVNAGDIVRIDYDSHSIFITEVTDDYIYFTDGNAIGYNVVRWDGKYSISEFWSRYCYRYHISGNTLLGGTPLKHTIAYRPNGGKGTVASYEQSVGTKLTLAKDAFTRAGYSFSGYSVKRQCDAAWYTKGHGWQPISEIIDNGYVIQSFEAGKEYSFGSGWVSGLMEPTTFTFYAQWLPDDTVVEYYLNESGVNYLCAPIEDGAISQSVRTDGGVYTVAVDDADRFNDASTLRVNASAPGGEGKDLSLDTTTNYGHYDGYTYTGLIGDNRGMTLGFVAKSSVKGAKMYIRFSGSSAAAAASVTLSDCWTRYAVPVPKNNNVGHRLLVYFDKKGTYSLNSMILADGNAAENLCDEPARVVETGSVKRGEAILTMPTPTREGYTFLGWFTRAAGGLHITPQTPVNAMRLRLYAHWRKDVSDIPVKTVTYGRHTYELYDNTLSYSDAAAFCCDKGGTLLSITNETEQQIVTQMLEDVSGFCWLGLTYDAGAKAWRWESGEPVRRLMWSPGEGSAANGETSAVVVARALDGAYACGSWIDCDVSDNPALWLCRQNSVFICEYIADPLPTEVVGHRVCGDVDGDDEVTIIDATRIQQHLAGMITLSEDSLTAADVDDSEDVTILDATMIQRCLAGLHDAFSRIGRLVDLTRVITSQSTPDEVAPIHTDEPTQAPTASTDAVTELRHLYE